MSDKRAGRPRKYEEVIPLSLRVPPWVVEVIDEIAREMEEASKESLHSYVTVSRTDVIVRWADEKKRERAKKEDI